MQSKNEQSLKSFAEYCVAHPKERFWQALRNWVAQDSIPEVQFIYLQREGLPIEDTFYWE